ncbi:DNA-binding protein [Photobacterium aquae]|uniref:DNA-binding protein n=1 Tax=Photobacterium aquae TaxID=1195763 RepID=A0A0J1GWC7_9GAMM|nr:TIGR02647 family protein [Photobacterium aquae]KLV03921.1 DNA-binding protein [Photobacterium aquae]
MPYNADLMHEMNLLVKFPMHSEREGIKVRSDAAPETVAAAKRLYAKGLVTQEDGGYLTFSGHQTVEHAKAALRILTGKVDVA